MESTPSDLSTLRQSAHHLEERINAVVIGQEQAVRLMLIAIFARGHVLLEGDVGVGKTTLLRAVSRGIGGAYQRIEGAIDLMPNDLLYHTFIAENGQPRVDPGPLLRHEDRLATFFFNEVNRARPQVHSLLLRVMAERSVSAFNQEYQFPHLLVFADRNRVEKEETFEMPSAARDRFLLEVNMSAPVDPEILNQLMFDNRFHDVDELISAIPETLDYSQLNSQAQEILNSVQTSPALQKYALDLCRASADPHAWGVTVSDTDMQRLVLAGVSPRGMSMLVRASRVSAWLEGRDHVLPEDIHTVARSVLGHRIFFQPVYEMRRDEIVEPFMDGLLAQVAAP